MERLKVSPNFHLDEFIPKEIYSQFGNKSHQFLDPRLIPLCEELRRMLKLPLTINDWMIREGGRNESGFRTPSTTTGATYSQHKFGRAVDIQFPGVTDYEKMRNFIRLNFSKLKEFGLSTIEKDTPTWLHLDIRTTNLLTLYEVPYK